MEVKLSNDYKKVLSIEQVQIARKLIKEMREDAMSTEEYAKMAIRNLLNKGESLIELIKCEATVAFNQRQYDRYFEGSGNADVWIGALAKIIHQGRWGFIEIGIYLSDAWDEEKNEEYVFVKRYKEI